MSPFVQNFLIFDRQHRAFSCFIMLFHGFHGLHGFHGFQRFFTVFRIFVPVFYPWISFSTPTSLVILKREKKLRRMGVFSRWLKQIESDRSFPISRKLTHFHGFFRYHPIDQYVWYLAYWKKSLIFVEDILSNCFDCNKLERRIKRKPDVENFLSQMKEDFK